MKKKSCINENQDMCLNERDAVLEIGTEELPARLFPDLLDVMTGKAGIFLKEERVKYSSVISYATPRRLVIYIKGVAPKGFSLVKKVRGPAYNIAFNDAGEPTSAAIGFAKAQKVNIPDLVVQNDDKGKFIYAISTVPGPEAKDALKNVFTRFINDLNFDRAMRWGDSDFKFARPVRWLLALLGEDTIEIEVNGIKGDRFSSGHRFLAPGFIEVSKAEDYFNVLEKAYCIVDQGERRAIIEEGIKKLAKEAGGEITEDEGLFSELTYMAEHPVCLSGKFNPELLKLPKEVIVTSMKGHQRYFPIEDNEGSLLPVFAAVRDGLATRIEAVRRGFERVLSARLEDARFFYEEDTKLPLEAYISRLGGITFHEGLGTVLKKIHRITDLSEAIADKLGHEEDIKTKTKRAAELCKADLVTNMVREFPELQGVMGKEYALLSGEDESVSQAVFEHYLPRFAGDKVPKNPCGVILAIADRIDTVAGFFGIGIVPSGSEDPYALRRSMSGIISILIEREIHLSVSWLVKKALSLYENEGLLKQHPEDTADSVLNGLRQRIRTYLIDTGVRYDLVDAVVSVGFDNILGTFERAKALQEAGLTQEFALACTGYTRASRLAGNADHNNIDTSLFSEPAEKMLFNALKSTEESISAMLKKRDYPGILKLLSQLATPINTFFNEVLVMAEDEKIRQNRLALLAYASSLALVVADLDKVVEKAV
ncbi:MAG: glycine--tRNA ligase subunit beta [Firmicutes bacterium]|nr:glycine--tRNA ligase subunit beta [Bacillota bacterium]